MKNPKLGASVLSVSTFTLKQKLIQLEKAGIDYFHIDIMDGNFVPNLSMPPSLYSDIFENLPNASFDLHFMVTKKALENLLPAFLKHLPQFVTIHQEAVSDWLTIAQKVRKMGSKFGLAINPGTPLKSISNSLKDVDLVLLMSVMPGYGGQNFIEYTSEKLRILSSIREKNNLSFLIQIDGGINLHIAKQLITLGADLIVIGSDLIKDPDPLDYMNRFRAL